MKKLIGIIVLVGIGAFAWWLIEPLLGDDVVNEELKVTERSINSKTENIEESKKDLDDRPVVIEKTEKESLSSKPETEVSRVESFNPTVNENTPEPKTEFVTEVQVQKNYSGNLSGNKSYTASGQVYIEGEYLSLANLNSTNVPDGYVYLATDKNATDFVSLGRLKGNVGNQNYSIPSGTDLDKYDTVLIWCKAFSVLVGSAELN